MRKLILALLLLPSLVFSATIDSSVKTWSTDWSGDLTDWEQYSSGFFVASALHYNATIGNYYTGIGGGSPQKKWDKSKPITARARMIRNSGTNWTGFSLYAGEAEYIGFSINSSGTVSYYNNAQYFTASNTFTANNQAVELQIEFDGSDTFTFKARNYDPTDTAAWTLIGTRTFTPTVPLTLQINHEGLQSGQVLWGRIDVTGSEVWGFTDVMDAYFWFPTQTLGGDEWGIEYNNLGTDAGVKHYLALAGGLTKLTASGVDLPWIQGTTATAYNAGDFQATSQSINPAVGFKYDKLELIGALRQGAAGSTLSVSIKKSDGTLVPSSDLAAASNPVTFTNATAVQTTIDLSAITYAGIYLEVNGHVTNATTKNWPDATGTTGPPILKQATITFSGATPITSCVANMNATFQ